MSEHIKSKLNITSLSKPYVSVNGSFGGDQSWLEKAEGTRKGNVLKNYGCGLIAASDILMYLLGGMEHVINPTGKNPMNSYEDYILTMERKYFRILPVLGISGVLLAWNLNMYFLLHRKDILRRTGNRFRSHWFVRPKNMLSKIREMLSDDIPVLIAIGPGFLRKGKVTFYSRTFDGTRTIFKPVTKTKDHYVTVTGIVEASKGDKVDNKNVEDKLVMLEISSWGKKYYVNYNEYVSYIKRYDNWYFSNMLYIKRV
ncbi:MAG: hypothetical protein J5684_02460 [Eubacterium sp.]|nr:hypothetical protein [Eubacterium sp.]